MNKKGAGPVGVATQLAKNVNRPTYDNAETFTKTTQKIYHLIEEHSSQLSPWEQSFLADVYGQEPLTKKQHIVVYRLYKGLHSTSLPAADGWLPGKGMEGGK